MNKPTDDDTEEISWFTPPKPDEPSLLDPVIATGAVVLGAAFWLFIFYVMLFGGS